MHSITRAGGLLAALMPCVLGVACGDPELASELTEEGPPEVLEVNVASESAPTDPNLNAIEAATYCRPGEEYKVNTLYCPLDRDGENAPIPGAREVDGPVLDATPVGWHARFIFDELIDPSIEELIDTDGTITGSIAAADPFVLSCGGVEIPYEGWYDPTGNHLSYPPGPSLVVHAIDFVATSTPCEVALRDGVVTDKDGEDVPGDHVGPYPFTIAPLSIGEVDPADATTGVDPTAVISIPFNAPIDLDTVADQITVNDGTADIEIEVGYPLDPKTMEPTDDTIVEVTPVGGLAAGTMYTVTVLGGTIADIAAGALADDAGITFSFSTAE
jgi:Bacterial Ig-like domain